MLSIVVPVFNEETVIPTLAERLAALAETLCPLECEFVIVDDGSVDATPRLLEGLAARDPRFRIISLSRNFGHQAAITAGLDYARGDAVVFMDADMQDPPEVVPQMVAKWREGYDVVYGRRLRRASDSFFKRASAACFYWLLRRIGRIDIPANVGDFRLVGRRAADELRRLREHHRLMRGLCAWIGFRQAVVDYERPPRAAGETKYSMRKMAGLALDSVFSFSWFPLRLASVVGLVVIAASSIYVLVNIFLKLFTGLVVPGWTSIVALVCLIGGMNLLVTGILGEYVGRIFEEVKGRPLYCVSKVSGAKPSECGMRNAECVTESQAANQQSEIRNQQ